MNSSARSEGRPGGVIARRTVGRRLGVTQVGPSCSGRSSLLDEPEAALSTRGCLAAIARIHDLVQQGSQFLVATHSPILLAVPDARILQIGDDGALDPVPYDDALPVRTTRRFLADPTRMVRELLD